MKLKLRLILLPLLLAACQSAAAMRSGSLSFQVSFPPRPLRIQLLTPESEAVAVAVMNPNSPQILAFRRLTREQNNVIINDLPAGMKDVMTFAVDTDNHLLNGALLHIDVIPGGRRRTDADLQPGWEKGLTPAQQQTLAQVLSTMAQLAPPKPPVSPASPASLPPKTTKPPSSQPGGEDSTTPDTPPTSDQPGVPDIKSEIPEVHGGGNTVTETPSPTPTPTPAPTPIPTPTPIDVGGGSGASIGIDITIIEAPPPPITVS